MNVGIFLKSREQEEGGGYTITYDILETLLNNQITQTASYFSL